MDEDENKSLEYILNDYLEMGQIYSFFVKCKAIDNGYIYYGKLDVEMGRMEELDDHCEQCFNEVIGWYRFRGDGKLCNFIGVGVVGLKKFMYFKERNELNKILSDNIEIINTLIDRG